MSFRFFGFLTVYLAIVAACVKAPGVQAAGLINTMTLLIALIAVIKVWRTGGKEWFWKGFLLVFVAMNAWFYCGTGRAVSAFTIADSAGQLPLQARYRNYPQFQSGRENVPEEMWFSFIANCFITTGISALGGVLIRDMEPSTK